MKKLIQLYQVKEEQTALKMGSGDLEVLATPALVAMMENCAKQLLAPELSSERTSVGFKMTLKHLVPSTVGAEVKVEAEMLENERNRVSFSIKAFDGKQLIGEADHQRVIVETAAFLKKVK
ncbi:thioesterase family protein [Enterococcus avium]|uniref:thioesterase family protein n=1 Tax=Enterococcus avium TaxID=33945 RepID=UPI00288F1506|nr:thioesterase family protein [Enterococcus avium]MDT2427332.1 thioesterase family protein [Enterococcus avium]